MGEKTKICQFFFLFWVEMKMKIENLIGVVLDKRNVIVFSNILFLLIWLNFLLYVEALQLFIHSLLIVLSNIIG